MRELMPSPSENKAVDLFLTAFPGSEIVSVDRNNPIPRFLPPTVADIAAEELERRPKPPPKGLRRGKKRPKNMDGMFDE